MADSKGTDITNKLAVQDKPKTMTVQQFFEAQIPNIAAVLPKGIMDPQRMAKLAIQIWTGNEKLAACTKSSFVAALITCAQFGLEPNTPLGQCFIIPYGDQATFQLGYQGLLALAYRTGEYKSIYVREVYKGDHFKVTYGIFEDIEHIPSDDGPADGELPTHIYAVYHLKNGGYNFECWSWTKIIKHAKKFSKSFNKKDGGWQTNPVSMGKKTVLIAVLKYAPKSLEMANAMEADDTAQADVGAKREYIDVPFDVREETTSSADGAGPTGEPNNTGSLDFENAMKGQAQA
ncbi:MAG: recombinase RecT [Syntrophomonadaceae bacterium]|nr:recombinase RecT [Syntrophomonadaceae bacterium]